MRIICSVSSLVRLALWLGGIALLAGVMLAAPPSSATGTAPPVAVHDVDRR
ncbi:hypothetical protein OG943_17535 [Amycolatopsis sp. NBC_00345]|uniref:hypothetical protein n=1 Tax=Amycolatopsis sp. NBC_00345 TaxID=2975955 RepID=UPI002E255ADD